MVSPSGLSSVDKLPEDTNQVERLVPSQPPFSLVTLVSEPRDGLLRSSSRALVPHQMLELLWMPRPKDQEDLLTLNLLHMLKLLRL